MSTVKRKLPNKVDYFYSPKETRLVLRAAKRADKGKPYTQEELIELVGKLNNKNLNGVKIKINKLRQNKGKIKSKRKRIVVKKLNGISVRVDKVLKRKSPMAGYTYHFPARANIAVFPDGRAALEFASF